MASVAVSKESFVPMVSPDAEEEDGLATSPLPSVVPAEEQVSTEGPEAATCTEATAASPVIDSALLSALRDHRERLGLLKLEQSLIDFVKSSDCLFWDIGGPMNGWIRNSRSEWVGNNTLFLNNGPQSQATSFQRCILHRLADRFQITREVIPASEDPAGIMMIRIRKTPHTGVPSRLLLNVPSSEYRLTGPVTNMGDRGQGLEQQFDQNLSMQASNTSSPGGLPSISTAGSGLSTPTITASSKPRKMKIMKRSGSGNGGTSSSRGGKQNSKNNGNRSTASTISDKERKYAEARARIFQQSQEEAMAETVPISSSVFGDTGNVVLAPAPTTTLSAPPSLNGLNDATFNSSTLTATSAEYIPAHAAAGSSSTTSENKLSKATWRNRQTEMNDPDFQRRGGGGSSRQPRVVVGNASTMVAPSSSGGGGTACTATIGFGYHASPQVAQQRPISTSAAATATMSGGSPQTYYTGTTSGGYHFHPSVPQQAYHYASPSQHVQQQQQHHAAAVSYAPQQQYFHYRKSHSMPDAIVAQTTAMPSSSAAAPTLDFAQSPWSFSRNASHNFASATTTTGSTSAPLLMHSAKDFPSLNSGAGGNGDCGTGR